MASGDTLYVLTPLNGVPPDTNPASLEFFEGAANHIIPFLAFDNSTEESYDFQIVVPAHFGGGSIDVTVGFGCGTTTGQVTWKGAFKSVSDDADDLKTKAYATAQSFTATDTPSVDGEVVYVTKTFTLAQADSPAAGEILFLRISRDASGVADDARLHSIELKES